MQKENQRNTTRFRNICPSTMGKSFEYVPVGIVSYIIYLIIFKLCIIVIGNVGNVVLLNVGNFIFKRWW